MEYTSNELRTAQLQGNVVWNVRLEGAFIGRFKSPRRALFFANKNNACVTPDITNQPRQHELF